jgi:hypothetical protein
VRAIYVLAKKHISIYVLLAVSRVGCTERKQVYFVSGIDTSNITLQKEQFETIEEALTRACEIEKTGAIFELFHDDTPAPIMDFTQVSAWCRSNSQ